MRTALFPANETDAALVGDGDSNLEFPDAPWVRTDATFGGSANFRSQYRIIDGALYRVLQVVDA